MTLPRLDYPGYGRERIAPPEVIGALVAEADILNGFTTPEFRAMVATTAEPEARAVIFDRISAARQYQGQAGDGWHIGSYTPPSRIQQLGIAWNREVGLDPQDPSFAKLAEYADEDGVYPSTYGAYIRLDWLGTFVGEGDGKRYRPGMGEVAREFIHNPRRYVDDSGNWRTKESLLSRRERLMRGLGHIGNLIGDIDYRVGMWLGNVIADPRRLLSRQKVKAVGGTALDGASAERDH